VNPVEALREIASLLERSREPVFKARAFRRAAKAIGEMPTEELERLAERDQLESIPDVGKATATVIRQALADQVPAYLQELQGRLKHVGSDAGNALREQLRGDLHLHSDWSDGGDTIRAMAEAALALGHEYIALTDHSPRLKIAHGLDEARLHEQLDIVEELNRELAPFRVLTGVECDILEDGFLDHSESVLERIDVVVASVHSKLRMEAPAMTERLARAMASPHTDILGHCTNRIVVGRGRAESEFDADLVFGVCAHYDKAVEINCRPERLDPPRRLLRKVVDAGAKVAIDTDAHAVEQLEWHGYGTDRAVEVGVPVDSIVNTWPVDELLAWCASHAARV
jgi:putative hydrolase